MKPILKITDGELELFGTVRTMKKAITTMLDLIEIETKNHKNVRIGISHAVNPKLADFAHEEIRKRMKTATVVIAEFSTVIGTHTGPGALGIAHLADD